MTTVERSCLRACSQVLQQYNNVQEPIYALDPEVLTSKINKWKQCLPCVRPFYAVKCNGHPALLDAVKGTGWGLDCASHTEIQNALTFHHAPEDIIFANPCKAISHIIAARDAGVTMTTFDSVEELTKLQDHWPNVQALLRVAVDDSGSLCQLSSKFGAPVLACPGILQRAQTLGINVVGLSFHVGSGCSDAYAFAQAVRSVHTVWKAAQTAGFRMQILDIGGGFPGDNDELFTAMACHLMEALSDCFPNVQLIAEPGRFFATACFTLMCPVIGKKAPQLEGEGRMRYYLADGTYGSFNNVMYDHATVHPLAFHIADLDDSHKKVDVVQRSECTLFGPTCDSIDHIMDTKLEELEVGDFVVFPNMGAYTFAAACAFNGFSTGKWFHRMVP